MDELAKLYPVDDGSVLDKRGDEIVVDLPGGVSDNLAKIEGLIRALEAGDYKAGDPPRELFSLYESPPPFVRQEGPPVDASVAAVESIMGWASEASEDSDGWYPGDYEVGASASAEAAPPVTKVKRKKPKVKR